jgi:hypothetical protein
MLEIPVDCFAASNQYTSQISCSLMDLWNTCPPPIWYKHTVMLLSVWHETYNHTWVLKKGGAFSLLALHSQQPCNEVTKKWDFQKFKIRYEFKIFFWKIIGAVTKFLNTVLLWHPGFVRCCLLDTCQIIKSVEMHYFMECQFENSGLEEIKKLVV